MYRVCTTCKENKQISLFRLIKSKRVDGYHMIPRLICIQCERLEKAKQSKQSYYSGRKIKQLVSNKRLYCQRKNIPFDLDDNWVQWAKTQRHCAVTGIEFKNELTTDTFRNLYGVSLHRKEWWQGYTKENTQLVINWVNLAIGEIPHNKFNEFVELCGVVYTRYKS